MIKKLTEYASPFVSDLDSLFVGIVLAIIVGILLERFPLREFLKKRLVYDSIFTIAYLFAMIFISMALFALIVVGFWILDVLNNLIGGI